MKFQRLIEGINWRQIVVHFVAAWFLMYAIETLSYLHNINLLNTLRQSGEQAVIQENQDNNVAVQQMFYFGLITGVSGFAGLLVAFIISLIISIKRHWSWFNSIIVLLIAYLLSWLDLSGWKSLKQIFLIPGQVFGNTIVEFLVNGFLMLGIGLLIFFLPKINRYIGGNLTTQ